MSKIAVVYYSATGHIYEMAEAVVNGAKDAGAEVRLRRVAELAPEQVIRRQDAWREHYERTEPLVAEVKLDDLAWADGFAFGSPTRFGLPAAQLKEFIDQTGPLWVRGRLANKVATSFTSSQHAHGGQESTLLALNNVLYHWGCLIVPPGYTHAVVAAAGGNPYGASYPAGAGDAVSTEALTAAHYQGFRLAQYAGRLIAPTPRSAERRDGASTDPLTLDPYDPPASFHVCWASARRVAMIRDPSPSMGRGTVSLEPLDDAIDHVRGGAAGRVILEYGDYECSYSGQADREIGRVERRLGDRVRFVFRHFPLSGIHPHALAAAAAAEAAALQDRFSEMHNLLFHHQVALESDDLVRYATRLELDVALFDRDRLSAAVMRRVGRDVESGIASGEVSGTPTLFIDGVIHRGAYDTATLLEALAR